MKGWFFSTVAAPQTSSFCCTGQSRPAVAELSFLCRAPFLLLPGSRLRVLYCKCQHYPDFFSSLFTYLSLCHVFSQLCSSCSQNGAYFTFPLVWDPSQPRGANRRWRDINLIASEDRYTDPGGCNKLRCSFCLGFSGLTVRLSKGVSLILSFESCP